MFCCIGIKLPPSRQVLPMRSPIRASHVWAISSGAFHGFSILWLLLFFFASPVQGTCTFCFGDAMGCSGSSDSCPWKIGIARNVTAFAAGTAIVLDYILPSKYLRLFTRPVLQILTIIGGKPKGGLNFDFTGKSPSAVYQAVVAGYTTKDDAIHKLNETLTAEEEKGVPSDKLVKQLERAIFMIQKTNARVDPKEAVDGVYLFILAKLSSVTCTERMNFDLCVEVSEEGDNTRAGSKKIPADLKRPQSVEQMLTLIHQFQMVTIATGITSITAIGPFLDDVIYQNICSDVPWFVAFELLVLYLRMVENEPNRYRVSNVYYSGALDNQLKLARKEAEKYYPAAFFRTPRGEPGDVNKDKRDPGGASKHWKGEIKGDSPNCPTGCISWNLGTDHLRKHVDPNTGKCKYRHACNQYVTDKGPRGQCLGAHKRADCTYPADKRCSTPHGV